MRTYGRVNGVWTEVTETTDVWLTTFVQTLKLQQGESPFYGNYGLPAKESVMGQLAPDAAVARTVAQYSQYFAALSATAIPGATMPTYAIRAVRPDGSINTSPIAT